MYLKKLVELENGNKKSSNVTFCSVRIKGPNDKYFSVNLNIGGVIAAMLDGEHFAFSGSELNAFLIQMRTYPFHEISEIVILSSKMDFFFFSADQRLEVSEFIFKCAKNTALKNNNSEAEIKLLIEWLMPLEQEQEKEEIDISLFDIHDE